MKHTKGPWTNLGYNVKECKFDVATEDNKKLIARLSVFSGEPETRESQANARLIAAAPELLEALQMIREHALSIGSDGGSKLDMEYSRVIAVLANQAINKAAGGEG